MGYIRHQGIIVTGCNHSDLGGKHASAIAREKAVELGLPCSEIVRGTANGYTSFLIAPDGSKEGWKESNDQDYKRNAWIEWARESNQCIDWVCVSFGGDDYELASLSDWNGREYIDPQQP